MLYRSLRPLAFALEPERAHALTIAALERLPPKRPPPWDPLLAQQRFGLDFPNPIGLAAGFDKDARVFRQMLGFGFGFVEVGTVTPLPQPGNPKPRLFRLAEDKAVINRLGFNNRGQAEAATRLVRPFPGVVGANIAANKQQVAQGRALADYVAGARALAPLADYLTVNLSSPNTPGLRDLQGEGLAELLAAILEASECPIFLKIAPDLSRAEIEAIARTAIDAGVAAIILGNTSLARPDLRSRHAGEAGGLSGAPIGALALAKLHELSAASGGEIALIAAGGIATGEDALTRILAGACLVQLYTMLVYEGPGVAARIAKELAGCLVRAGFARLTDAIGAGKPPG